MDLTGLERGHKIKNTFTPRMLPHGAGLEKIVLGVVCYEV